MEEKLLSAELFEKSPLYLAYRLVEEGKIDPWDVDLEKLIQEYLETIRKIELRDLRVPAKVVAFATFLIKKQLEILFPRPPRPRRRKISLREIEEEFSQTNEGQIIEDLKREVRRRKTAGRRKVSKKTEKEKTPPGVPLHRAKLEEALEYLLELLERLEARKKLAFSRLATRNDYVAKLWALLNLTNEGKVDMEQSEPFGEIYFWKVE
ncbi:MAG: segregation/condensation protein A [Aquificae bacterium]|nr:segregation/condensation protein A [Aquificota bacterium]